MPSFSIQISVYINCQRFRQIGHGLSAGPLFQAFPETEQKCGRARRFEVPHDERQKDRTHVQNLDTQLSLKQTTETVIENIFDAIDEKPQTQRERNQISGD